MTKPPAKQNRQDRRSSTAHSPRKIDETATSLDPFPPPHPLPLAVAIEPDLRLLKGLLTALRYLGERSPSDPIEPAAIAALSLSAEDAVDRLIALRRQDHMQE